MHRHHAPALPWRRTTLALAAAACAWAATPAAAQTTTPPTALPVLRSTAPITGATVSVPSATVPAMSINQSAQRAVIDWASFNIGSQASVTVSQPNSTSILLNRVSAGTTGQGPSTIDGLLQANGRVFILDPNGVVFGSTARVHVGGLLAAAMTMTSTDASFIAGTGPLTLVRDPLLGGSVTVLAGAQIDGGSTAGATTPAAEVALLAGNQMQLAGAIDATRVVLGAGGGAQVPIGDSGFITLSLTPAVLATPNDIPPTVSGTSSGSVRALGGSVQVIAASNGTGSESTGVDWAAPIDATGGSIRLSGSSDFGAGVDLHGSAISAVALPVTLSASSVDLNGTSVSGQGVVLSGVDINASTSITITGRSFSSDAVQVSPLVGPVNLKAPTQRIVGRSEIGSGVFMQGAALSGDLIEVRGVSAPVDPAVAGGDVIGTDISATTFTLGSTGQLLITGRGEVTTSAAASPAFGLLMDQVNVVTPAGAGRSVTLVGEAVNGTGSAGLVSTLGGTGMFSVGALNGVSAADVIIGADAPLSGSALGQVAVVTQPVLQGPLAPPDIVTTGHINLRPAGVDLNGNIVEHPTQAIRIETDAAPGNTSFVVPGAWLVDRNLNDVSPLSASRLVIGSSLHQGDITVARDMLRNDTLPLTLQNQGSGSAGVVLQGNSVAVPDLAVLSAGPINQSSGMLVDHLLLQGTGSNRATLVAEGNIIGSLSFANLGSLDLFSGVAPAPAPAPAPPPITTPVASVPGTGPGTTASVSSTGPAAATPTVTARATAVDPTVLAIDAATVQGYDPATGSFSTVAVTTSGAAGDVLIQATGRSLLLNSSIALSGAGANLNLVTDGFFTSPGTATLSAGPGGTWRVWAPNWVGSDPGSVNGTQPAPQMFGCVFGDVSLCRTSQVALPAGRSGFFYADQPTLTVSPVSVSSEQGRPLPALPFDVTGLIGADTAAGVLTGALATPATPVSPVGSYPVNLGSLASPLGYRVILADTTAVGTAVTLTPAVTAPPPVLVVPVAFTIKSTSSETYGRNLSAPSMCLAPGAARREREGGDVADLLGLEWGRVRQQPQLSSCLTVNSDSSCTAF